MSAIVEWMSLVPERGSIKHDGGHYALRHENGKPTDTASLPEVMLASAQEFAQRRRERHVKQADMFEVWQACGGRTEARPGQPRVRDVVIGYQDGMVPRPCCYAPIDRGEMSSRFATR